MICWQFFLHSALDKLNADVKELLVATKSYRRVLLPDIGIKCAGLILALVFCPPLMMYSVLAAAVYMITRKHQADKKRFLGK